MAAGEVRDREGWRLEFSTDAGRFSREIRDKLIEIAIAAADGKLGLPHRRSRHAATYQVKASGGQGRAALEAFVKVYDPPRGRGAVKRLIRGSRAAHAARASAALRAHGFGVPRLILCGEQRATGRAMLVTERAEGVSLAEYLGEPHGLQTDRKREVWRALGTEVARLHRAGYIHGDLTPHNIFLASLEPPRFVFIDHDRTRRALVVGRRRRQLRNLVQLFRFDLPGLSDGGRMQIFEAWAAGLELPRRDIVMRRVFDMLKLRMERDREKARIGPAREEAAGARGPAGTKRARRAGGAL